MLAVGTLTVGMENSLGPLAALGGDVQRVRPVVLGGTLWGSGGAKRASRIGRQLGQPMMVSPMWHGGRGGLRE